MLNGLKATCYELVNHHEHQTLDHAEVTQGKLDLPEVHPIFSVQGVHTRLGAISKMDIPTLQYFTFALKLKANTKMLHLRVLNHPLMASKAWGQASTIL